MTAGRGRLLAIASILGATGATGCAFGRHHAYHLAKPFVERGPAMSIALAVQDQRDSVLMGGRPDFVGLMRAGFGNSYDVTTVSGQPLAADFAASIRRGLESVSFRVTTVKVMDRARPETVASALAKTGAERLMVVAIDLWKTDTLSRTWLFYGVRVQVLDPRGQELGHAAVSGKDVLAGTEINLETTLPKAYTKKLEQLLNDPAVLRALGRAAESDPDEDDEDDR